MDKNVKLADIKRQIKFAIAMSQNNRIEFDVSYWKGYCFAMLDTNTINHKEHDELRELLYKGMQINYENKKERL